MEVTSDHLDRETLLKLRDLMIEIKDVPIIDDVLSRALEGRPTGFNMRHLSSRGPCGTAACAGGWAIWAGIVPEWSPDQGYRGNLPRIIFKRIHGVPIDEAMRMVLWVFGSFWEYIAPTPMDVVTRIDYLLSGDEAIEAIIGRYTHEEYEALWKEVSDAKAA